MELFRLSGVIDVDNAGANRAINDTTSAAEASGSKLSKIAAGIGNVVGKVAKVGVAAVGVAATGIAALTKTAIENYSDYEQLVGGVETLFKKSSGTVLKYANEAYKTAGMSSNKYMETVTSFSASLLQGLNGDTAKAAKIADMAIIDMSDNANKMGSDMSLIENAYQGFAKQNYTMLDNLKLGYGGTQTEMARLINDSGVLGGTMKVTAKNVNDVSFDKIIEAIHVMQTRMGITGTTSKEAASTIQGSIAMMKAAWTNFTTGLADPKQDIGKLMGNLVDSVITVINNLAPRIVATLPRVAEGLAQLISLLARKLPSLIAQLLPPLLNAAFTLIKDLITGLPSMLMTLVPALLNAFKMVLSRVFDSLGVSEHVNTFINKFSGEFSGKVGSLQTLFNSIKDFLEPVGQFIANTFLNNIKILVSYFKNVLLPTLSFVYNVVTDVVSSILDAVTPFIEDVLGLLGDIQSDLTNFVTETIMPFAGDVINALADMFERGKGLLSDMSGAIQDVLSIVFDAINSIYTRTRDIIIKIYDVVTQTFSPVIDMLKDSFNNMIETVKPKLDEFKNKFGELVSTIRDNLEPVFERIKPELELLGGILGTVAAVIAGVVVGAVNGLIKAFSNIIGVLSGVIEFVSGFIEFLVGVFTGDLEKITNGVKNMWSGIKTAFVNGIEAVINFVKGFVSGIINFFKSLYNTLVGHSIVPDMINAIINYFKQLPSKITSIVSGFVNSVVSFFNSLLSKAKSIFNSLSSAISNIFNTIKSVISNIVSSVVSSVTSKFNSLKSSVSSIFNSIKSTTSNIFNSIKSTISNVVSGIKSNILSGFNSAKSTVSSVFNSIKSVVSSAMSSAKSIVSSSINSIKGFFNFKVSFPKIKLPHFSVSGSSNPIDWLDKGVPKLSVKWYAKGGILDRAALIGHVGGTFLGAGEYGREAILPLDHNNQWIDELAAKVAAVVKTDTGPSISNRLIIDKMDSIQKTLYNLKIYLDGKALVGELVGDIDSELGKIYRRR